MKLGEINGRRRLREPTAGEKGDPALAAWAQLSVIEQGSVEILRHLRTLLERRRASAACTFTPRAISRKF
jgi:hypothetical protein